LTEKVVQKNQPFEWFITITGTKVGELALLSEKGLEIPSYDRSSWPGKSVQTPKGELVFPDIMIL